jgi:hypothetical protein
MKSGGHSLKGLCKESSYAEKKPYLQTSIQQTTIDVNGNCDVHPTRSDPYPPVILLGPPLSYLLAFQTRTAQCVSCLQIECFYRDSFHCDFLPYDIDTIQANLLSQHPACRATRSAPCRYGGQRFLSVVTQPLFFTPLGGSTTQDFSLGLWLIRKSTLFRQ